MIDKNSEIKFIVIQAVLTLLIAFIPIYFYLESSFENRAVKDKVALKNYASSVVMKIDEFAYENSDLFFYPRSNIFRSAIYDQDDEVIFSLLGSAIERFDTEFISINGDICYKHYMTQNLFDAKYMVVCKEIDDSEVIYNAIILLITVVSLMFLSSFATIKQSIEPYKKLNRYLDEFLKDAMHELKTPIGVARINLDMLSMRVKNDKYLLRIKSALKNMTVVYEDLEYYIKRHKIKDQKKQMDISSFLSYRVDFFEDLACAKNIRILRDIDDGVEICFNEIELYRIIDNNLSNAVKYSKEGSIIKVSLKKQSDKIILIFEDEGIGIKDTSKIFQRYYRGDKISGGFGIGLSIVKNICDKNDIKIEVNSKAGEGSRFVYRF